MYYCKKCGKSLPDNARFCDRCNTSVRQQGGKKELIEDLKEERLARRKAKAVEERLRKIKKLKHRRFKLIIGSIVILTVLGVASAVITNIVFTRTSTISGSVSEAPNTTEATEVATEEAASTQSPVINSDGYIVTSIYNTSFAYPSSFVSDGNEAVGGLLLSDSMGDATLVAEKITATQSDPREAMKSCIETNDLVSPSAAASDTMYSVTGVRGENVYHRFAFITDGTELYYELIWPGVSARASEYKEYAEYMDSYLKSE